ncbi:MAG: response regulator [Candidatus Colwellbacteria bacterium]|nr:response regulator [Candidatus Colwellbacteria bacterium]
MSDNKPVVLLVDDTEDFREIFSIKLKSAGFDVQTAASGEECIEKLKSIKPNLVLMDLQMPTMDGVKTVEHLRLNPDTKNTRVVFLTNYGEPTHEHSWTDKQFAKQIGAEDYIRKTEDLDEIVKHIKEHAGEISYTSS